VPPGPSPAPARGEGGAAALSIGQVLARLRPEFPTISVSKIRFFEEKGLVSPERTATKYRKFREADVDRLRYALTVQRDHYLPLKVIAEHLEALDRGEEPPALEPVVPSVPTIALAPDGTPSAAAFARRDGLRLSRQEVLRTAGIEEDLLAELERQGLVAPRPGTRPYDSDALVVAETARELARFGLEPRHLRSFRAAADREVGLVEQATAPLRRARDAAAQARAEDAATQVAALAVRLHATLLRTGLRRS